MHSAIAQHRSGISAICQRYRISRLEVFGSAARAQDFDPERYLNPENACPTQTTNPS